MSGQQLANIEPSGEITKQQSSHSESAQSYAIPGGEAHEQSRDASRLMEANIPGGQMKQQTQEHQFAKQAQAVQETAGGVQKTSEAATAQQQVSQSVSNSQTTGADGSISTRKITSKRTVQQSSSVKQSSISSTTSAHPAQGMIQAPQPSELQLQNLARQQQNQMHQVAHQQQQLAQQQQLPDLTEGQTAVSKTQHTHHSHKQVTQTTQKVTQGSQQQHQQQQLVQGSVVQQPQNMPAGGQPAPPVFEQIFRNARFAQGGNALFEGTVRGNPRPTIAWTRQGRPINDSNKYQLKYNPTSGEVSLMICRIGPGDEGEYTCLARNQYGEAICTVYIQPEAAYLQQQQQQQHQMQQQSMQRRMISQQHDMQFRQEMTSTTGSTGHTTTSSTVERQFHSSPFGQPFGQPSVQQQTEEFRVDTFEYRLIRETEFRESLTRRYAGETETETEVETETESRQPGPLSPPQVQTKPRATKVVQNGDATFQARLVGNPKPKVTWFRNGVRLRPGPRANITHSNSSVTLRLRSVQQEDSGHYTMLAENAAGCVVSSAFLAVEPAPDTVRQGTATQRVEKSSFMATEESTTEDRTLAPTFLRVPTDKETQEGKMVRLECRTSGKPSPEVLWYINGLPVVNDATHKIMVNEAGSHALMITNASQRDSGVVTCVAKNKNGQTQFQVNLNVLEREQVIAPKFVERFQTVHVRPGEPVSLSCRAVGAPTPRITWQKDGAPLDSSPDVRVVTDGGASMLDIPCVRPEDGAWYQCTAQNAAGSTATRAKLYVEAGPAPPASEPWRLHLPKPTKVIEPPPPQESEIIHLRHVERSRPKPQRPAEERPAPPPQFTHPLRDTAVREGDHLLLEAKLTPLGDPTMRIEWYINGQPLPASSRATLTDKFGYVSLSLLSVVAQDSGSYTCRAVNQAGSADSTCTVSVGPRSGIETTPQHPQSLQPIEQLEDNSRYVLKSASMEMHNVRPSFVHELRDVAGVAEGSHAHFEAQIQPVSDPFMKIEWFKDGRPITAGSRISTINNFGYLALNINQLRPEDSGVYTVRATNKAGESCSQAQLAVSVPDSGVTGDLGIPEQQRYIQSVEQLEAYKQSIYQQVTSELEEKTVPPQFTQPIRDAPSVPENGTAHFEARLEPVGDATMTIHWFKDGRPLEASSRMTTFFNFGYVSLTIKQVSVFDTGSYTCVARNAAGQTQCQARLQCVGRQDVVTDSQMESMQRIQYLEDSSRFQRSVEEDVTVTKIPPKFLSPIKGTNVIREDQKAHFEARLEPQNDPTMKTEWYHDGKPLTSANRIQTFLNFGYVALDISAVKPEDSGIYTLVATNALGEVRQETQMRVEARSAIDTTSIHRAVVDKTERLERSKFQEPQYDVGDYCKSKPRFTEPLRDPPVQVEGRGIHMECRLEPLNDPTMRVEWFQNGRPVTIGSRFRTYSEFGFVALDVLDLTSADAGEYTVRATNQLGSAHTSAMVRVRSHADVDTETQHEAALDQIQYLESGSKLSRQMTVDTAVEQVPTFTKSLRNIETVEGTNVHLECRLQPVGDNSMKVEWFVNDQPLKIGHRFRPAYDFDYVALDLLSVYPADSGMYTCRATNRLGQAVTSASVRIIERHAQAGSSSSDEEPKKDLYTDHPGSLERIQFIEDTSRYQRKEWADEMVQVKPKFTTQLKHQENLRENQTAHFEAKLEPVADANLHVEWLKDGKPITVGHRHRPLHDFGYVALDIVGVIEQDNGVYTCRATNNLGFDETSAILRCSGDGTVLTVSQHETGLERVQMLEDRSRLTRSETMEEMTTQAPVFTTSLSNISIKEGQRAHFESRLIPVSDPTMTVQWFHNGRPVKAGSRFMETNSFGFVALDIMYAYPEDQGTYTCKATNALGEAVTQATLSCTVKGAIDQGSLHEQALDKLRHLEMKARPTPDAEESTAQAPVFTQPARDVRLVEGQPLHLEARLIPVGDPKLRVEWFKNGVPLQQANRISTLHDFGFVALDMKYTQEDDSGTYTCRATNELGQAVTSATAVIQSKETLLLETQNASSLEKLRQLEDRTIIRTEIEETVVTEKPRFVTELTGPTTLVEGQSAHMEARIEPYPDADMKVEWFHNGKAVGTGHRFRTVNDFGFIALDVLSAYPEDSGEYTVKITNRLGTATSTININIQARASLIQETQHPAAMQKISYLESDRRREVHEEAARLEKPVFGRPLRNASLAEGQSAHLEATLTPVNDATMKVEWFYNGRPIPQGHRFRTMYDFGYVALDILYTYPEDSGTYMCKATNAAGEAVTTCEVAVEGRQGLCLDTLDAARLEKIRNLESSEPSRPEEAVLQMQKPVFTTPLNNLENLQEGQHAHLECRLEPINDPRLKVEWFVNGKEIRTGHRFRTTHDFGYVALDILYGYPEDSGTYMCKATNEMGEAVNTCTIRVNARRSIYLDTQHPEGWQKIRDLESREAERPVEAEVPKEAPRFVQELRGPTQLAEGGVAHMEGRVEPLHDSDLRVEFFHNGKPLQSASRFHTTFDFGYVSLDIRGLVEEDAGEYTCRAINTVGEASSSLTIQVLDKEKIILSSQHPGGLEAIRQLEERSPEQRQEEAATYQKPMFTHPLQSDNRLDEGQAVHLEARLIPVGDPKLTVEWFRNEQPLQFGSRFKPTHDFGYVALDIAGLRPEDEGVYSCRATNELGQAVTTASIRIKSEANIVLDTQHPGSVAKLAALEQKAPGAPAEPEQDFEKPVFTMPLTGPADLIEGQHVHFQARCVPVGDPHLHFEWYCNGVELKLGSRIKETHDFGFITLDIMSVIPEDAGMYMCKAINRAGDAVTTTSLRVHDRSSILGDAIHATAWDKIQLKEAEMNRVPEMYVEQRPQQPPVFTTHLQSHDRLLEQQSVHLEATVEPKTDPNLRVEWSKNGVPLMTGARLRSTFDFGLVTLDIMGLRGDDSGIYTCRALNLMGEAVSTCTLKVEDKHWLLGQSQRPDALPAIAQLELGRAPAEPASPDVTFELPVFVSHLNNVECDENARANFECRVEPAKDPNMTIEWFLNGEPMKSGSRFTTHYDFGLVQLDIAGTQLEDAGLIVCKATNQKGSAQTSGTLRVKSSSDIFKETGEKPRFVTQIQSVESLQDGDSAHFECTLEPVGDPDMKVEWFHNGQPLRHSSRIKAVSDFGYVLLDIAYGQTEDSGEYECRATNKHGSDSTRATLRCQGRGGVFLDSLQPQALKHISELEMTPEVDGKPPSPGSQAPRFTKHISEISNMVEGHSAHFEARLTPVHDPDLTVEWYRNGEKLPTGHRFRTFHDFGIVILDILYCYEEDSGLYECRAANKVGSDVTKAELKCVSKESLILTPQMPKEMSGGLEKIQNLEDSTRLTREEREDVTTRVAPRFTVPFNNIDDLREGENAHFEARLTPVDDPKLKTEWYHNSKPLKASSRFRTFCDFGFVILEISPVYPEDSGEYTCRAYNEVGEATSTAVMKCSGKRNIILETQLPKGMETMQKIADLENLGIKPIMPGETEEGAAPQFLTQPADISLVENQLAHFECRLSPVGDPTMRVEWYHNGKPLSAGSRVRTINDFGYVILEIGGIYQRDAGLYTCKAVNKHGEASVSCTLTVKGRQGVVLEPQMPHGMEGIRKLEESLYHSEQTPAEDAAPQPPRFVTEIQSQEALFEGQPAHFDCRVEPVGDPSMRIEWFHNGRPIDVGSRVHFMDDFGFIVLDLDWTFPRDSGEYVCRATNKWGTATTKANLICKAKRDVVLESQLPKGMSGDRLRTLEEGPKMGEPLAPEEEAGPPRFIKEIGNVDVGEGETAFFDCKVEPKNDPYLRVEWFRNGVQVQTGHRFRTTFDFGYASLQILGVYPEDGGEYTCRAVNRAGQATCKSALTCRAISSVIMLTQVPKGMKRSDYLMQMEATLKQYTSEIHLTEEDIYDADRKQPPRFVTQIQSRLDLVEMEQTKFECQLAPVGDPNMKVEWFFNGRPLPHKNRFTPIYDFGYVAMNFGWVYPEDSGEYLCRATNLYGMDETRAVIKTKGKPGIVYESQLPKGMESVKKIQEMESLWNRAPDAPLEEERAREAPVFVTKPEPVTVNEGDWARFCCRVTGHPRPRVMWLINGHTIVNGTRYKLTYDGMWRLDIPKTRQYDHGKIEVVARNSAGEAYCSCEININARQDDYRAVLKNSPKRHDEESPSYRKPDWVVQMEETKAAIRARQQPPQFTTELTNQRAKENSSEVEFKCAVSGVPRPEVTLFHNDLRLSLSRFVRILYVDDRVSLVLCDVSPDMAGQYTVRAVNPAGEATSTATLEVQELSEEERQELIRERQEAVEKRKKREQDRIRRMEEKKRVQEETARKIREKKELLKPIKIKKVQPTIEEQTALETEETRSESLPDTLKEQLPKQETARRKLSTLEAFTQEEITVDMSVEEVRQFITERETAERKLSEVQAPLVQEVTPELLEEELKKVTAEKVVAETKLAVLQSYTVQEINPQTTVDELKTFVDERHEAEQVWNTVETLEIVQPAQQHISEEIKQLKQDCAVAEVKLDLIEGFEVQELRPELSTEQLETYITERRDAKRRISTVESLAVQEASPEEVVKDLAQMLAAEETSAKIKLDLLNTYSVQEVTTDTTAEETKTFIEERHEAEQVLSSALQLPQSTEVSPAFVTSEIDHIRTEKAHALKHLHHVQPQAVQEMETLLQTTVEIKKFKNLFWDYFYGTVTVAYTVFLPPEGSSEHFRIEPVEGVSPSE